jgi:hypothetical protein
LAAVVQGAYQSSHSSTVSRVKATGVSSGIEAVRVSRASVVVVVVVVCVACEQPVKQR